MRKETQIIFDKLNVKIDNSFKIDTAYKSQCYIDTDREIYSLVKHCESNNIDGDSLWDLIEELGLDELIVSDSTLDCVASYLFNEDVANTKRVKIILEGK